MFKLIKRFLTAATVVLAASAPSVAYARILLDPPGPPATASQVQGATVPSIQRTAASAPQGFHWDDAGIGAAGVLVLVSVGSAAIIARRRRTHQPLTS
jgi:hypothetical protein